MPILLHIEWARIHHSDMNDSRLLVAIPSLYSSANYVRFSVCLSSPGVSYPPVSTVVVSVSYAPASLMPAYGS